MVTLKNQNDKMSWLINESLQDDTYFPHFFYSFAHLEKLCIWSSVHWKCTYLITICFERYRVSIKKNSFFSSEIILLWNQYYNIKLLSSGIFLLKSKSKQKLISHFCNIKADVWWNDWNFFSIPTGPDDAPTLSSFQLPTVHFWHWP